MSAQRNETKTKQFWNSFVSVLLQFHFFAQTVTHFGTRTHIVVEQSFKAESNAEDFEAACGRQSDKTTNGSVHSTRRRTYVHHGHRVHALQPKITFHFYAAVERPMFGTLCLTTCTSLLNFKGWFVGFCQMVLALVFFVRVLIQLIITLKFYVFMCILQYMFCPIRYLY